MAGASCTLRTGSPLPHHLRFALGFSQQRRISEPCTALIPSMRASWRLSASSVRAAPRFRLTRSAVSLTHELRHYKTDGGKGGGRVSSPKTDSYSAGPRFKPARRLQFLGAALHSLRHSRQVPRVAICTLTFAVQPPPDYLRLWTARERLSAASELMSRPAAAARSPGNSDDT